MEPTPNVCAGCLLPRKGKETLKCTICKSIYDLDCANIPFKKFQLMGKDNRQCWKCPKCRSVEPKVGNINTPVNLQTRSSDNVTMRGMNKPRRKSSDDIPDEDINDSNGNLRALIKEELDVVSRSLTSSFAELLTERLSKINETITSLESSLSHSNSLYEDLKVRLALYESREKALEQDLLEANNKITLLSNQITANDQNGRMNNLEITGIPYSKVENLNNILNNIAVKVGFELKSTDIDYVHRVRKFPMKTDSNSEDSSPQRVYRPANIIVRFTQRQRKRDLLAAVRARRSLTTVDAGIDGAAKPVFINDHLTRFNKNLYRQVRQLGKEKNFRYIWINDSKIFVRKNETSKALLIRCELDLDKIK